MGDISHILSKCILIFAIYRNKSAEGKNYSCSPLRSQLSLEPNPSQSQAKPGPNPVSHGSHGSHGTDATLELTYKPITDPRIPCQVSP